MKLTSVDEDGKYHIITTSGGIPVSESFEELEEAQVVLTFLLTCDLEDADLDHPRYAEYSLLINEVRVGFRSELAQKIVWLAAQPAWKMIVDALGLTLYDITIYEHPEVGETLAIKRRSSQLN